MATTIPLAPEYSGPIALRSNPLTFPADAESQYTYLAGFSVDWNTTITAMNTAISETEGFSDSAETSKDLAETAATNAENSATQAAADAGSANGNPLGDYANNIIFNSHNDYVSENGLFRLKDSVPTPYTTNTTLYPLATDDDNLAPWSNVDVLKSIALALNVPREAILNGVAGQVITASTEFAYNPVNQTTYGLPAGIGVGEVIISVVGDQLETDVSSPSTYTLRAVSTDNGAIVYASTFSAATNMQKLISAIEYAKTKGIARVICDIPEIRVSNPNRSQGTYSSYETWNFAYNIDGFDGEIDLSMSKFIIDPWATSDTRITVFTVTDCSGEIRLPKVDGQLPQHNMASGYIDDCFMRIGGGCDGLTVHNTRLITDYPGHGLLVRHYTEDTGAADLSTNIPTDVDIIGRGGVVGSWQSNVVTVTGYSITVTVNTSLAGNNSTLNSQQSTTGHGVHFEAVTDGSQNPYCDNQKAINCKSTYNRLNGIMFHTAISNYQSLHNYSAFNQQHGAEYQAFCDGLVSFGNVFEQNQGKGMLVGLSTALWKGSETKNSNATIHDTMQFNNGIGFEDLSHGVNLALSGTIKRCALGGYFAADGTSTNRNVLTNLTIADCGENQNPPVYAATITTEILSDVKIVNSDDAVYRQIPFRFKSGRSKMGANVTIIGNSADDTDFDADFDQPSRLPLVDTSVRLRGDLATISNGCVKIQDKGTGEWLIPTGFLTVALSNASGQYPSYKLTDSASLDLIGTEFIIHNDGGNNASINLRSGLVNGASSFTMLAATSYRVRYIAENEASVIAV